MTLSRPFVILALPRTGTKMVAHALGSHPEINGVVHEFRGGFRDFLKHPYVLSNYRKWWMRWPIRVIHLYREDSIAGAKSLLLMSYNFPDRSFSLPEHEVLALSRFRREQDIDFSKAAKYSVSYESLCDNKEISRLPAWFVDEFCELVGIKTRTLYVSGRKPVKKIAANDEGLRCLAV